MFWNKPLDSDIVGDGSLSYPSHDAVWFDQTDEEGPVRVDLVRTPSSPPDPNTDEYSVDVKYLEKREEVEKLADKGPDENKVTRKVFYQGQTTISNAEIFDGAKGIVLDAVKDDPEYRHGRYG